MGLGPWALVPGLYESDCITEVECFFSPVDLVLVVHAMGSGAGKKWSWVSGDVSKRNVVMRGKLGSLRP